jgi:HSP20 family protein
MNLINWRPKTVSSYHSLPNAFERMIDDNFFVNYDNNNWTPSVDINESSDTFIINADLPGIKKSDIEVKIEENILTLKAERKIAKKNVNEKYHFSERRSGTFSRSFKLPKSVKEEKITADFDNGVLSINIPKAEDAITSNRLVKVK